jgi:metal-responsive CopG/Arc/MetJ family transcriptional regulator
MKDNLKQLGAKVPDALLKKLDKAAKKSGRTRSSEVRLRLEQSLRDRSFLGAAS